jgi:SAM-dependent methyltransferase
MPDEQIQRALAGVETLYSGNLAEHGRESKSVGWPDEASQLLRFEKLALVMEGAPPDRSVSVNDFGCGYAAMFSWLDSRPSPRIDRYIGYDISDEMLRAAREQANDPRVELIDSREVTEQADYSLVSGTFNVRIDASDDEWGAYVRECLVTLCEKSRLGFAFNLLTSYVDWRKDDLFYADPAEWFTFCKQELSRYVTLIHDYPLYEWTMLVRKET